MHAIFILISPLLFILSWVGFRFLYCVFNYQVYKRKLSHIPAIKDPFARLKALSNNDPSTSLWKENTELAGAGNVFLPVVFIGPYIDMGRPVVMVNSPELIREVSDDSVFPKLPAFYDPSKSVIGGGLVSESGERWKKMRGILSPLFHYNKIKQFATHMTSNTDELISFLRTKDGAEVNCAEVLSEATLSILIDCISSKKDIDPKWTAKYLEKSGEQMMIFALSEFIFGSTLNSFFPWARAVGKTRRIIYDKVAILCERARNFPAQDGNTNLIEFLVSIKGEDNKQVLSDVEIADETMVFLFGGYDTIKSAIGWTLYFLCLHRHELEKLQNEVDMVLNGRTATYDDVPNLPKVKNAIMEGQRLRPSNPGLERTTFNDTELGGYFIPKKTSIYLNWHAAHTDPTLWERPEEYFPDRFDNPGCAKNFFGFSYGPRNCIGQKFAHYETVIITASLLHQFDIQMGSAKVKPAINLAQEAVGFTCKFIPRR